MGKKSIFSHLESKPKIIWNFFFNYFSFVCAEKNFWDTIDVVVNVIVASVVLVGVVVVTVVAVGQVVDPVLGGGDADGHESGVQQRARIFGLKFTS